MDKCKLNKEMKMDNGNMIKINKYRNEVVEQEEIVNFLVKKYPAFLKGKRGFVLRCVSQGETYCVDLCRLCIVECDRTYVKKFMSVDENFKVYTFRGRKVIVKTPSTFSPEALGSIVETLTYWKDKFSTSVGAFRNAIEKVKGVVRQFEQNKEDVSYWLIDCMALLSELADPYAYGVKRMLTMIARLYTLLGRAGIFSLRVHRQENVMRNESLMFGSIVDAVSAFIAIGAPPTVLSRLKDIGSITGVRITDSAVFVSIFCKVVLFFGSIIDWFQEKCNFSVPLLSDWFNYFKSYAENYELIREVTELYTKYIKNPQVMVECMFREKVLNVSERCKAPSFLEYVNNDNNKFFRPLYNAFTSNIVKYAATFEVSSKEEPICIVFSGPPGCGKSVMMNYLVNYLRSTKSVYVHTVPALSSGKDFYDDYLNQEVFVMDDVGQQSNSQWRHIINFVSPVKYPLECATAELKNTKMFNSKIILCTTNKFRDLTFTTTDGIADRGALFRRVHLFECKKGGDMDYFKYDYNSPHPEWKEAYLEPYKEFFKDFPVHVRYGNNLKQKTVHMMKFITRLQKCQEHLASSVDLLDADRQEITRAIEEDDIFLEAESMEEEIDERNVQNIWRKLTNGVEVMNEYLSYIAARFTEFFQDCFNKVTEILLNMLKGEGLINGMTVGIFCGVSIGIMMWMYTFFSGKSVKLDSIEEAIERWKGMESESLSCKNYWQPEASSTIETSVKSHFRFVEVMSLFDGNEVTEFCQAMVSGNRIMLPDHVVGDKPYIKVYKDWDAYMRKEMELDHCGLRVVAIFPNYDCVICEFVGLHINLYKLAKAAFCEGNMCSSDLRFVNCYHNLVLNGVGGFNSNTDKFSVRSLKSTVVYEKDQGIVYKISSKGLCGSGLLSKSQGIVGMHVAGNGEQGFATLWPKSVRESIHRALVLEQSDGPFGLKETGRENFSGARLVYDQGAIKPSFPITETSMIKTLLHTSVNEEMAEVAEQYNITPKAPPNFKSKGSPQKTLAELSLKSFATVGKVDREELEFAEKILEEIIPEFGDITLEEAVFGNEELVKLNMKASNGYGWNLSKLDLFNQETKEIHPEFKKKLEEFEEQCKTGKLDIEHVLARETFKDELRVESKVDSPRTFRVMPVQQMVATKMCFGNLLVKIKEKMWKNGIAIGLNPYKDWDRIYQRMKVMAHLFDIDFKMWDGKLHPLMQDICAKVFKKRYTGQHRAMFDVLVDTMTRGYVLVGDAVFATTHSIFSGIWITALVNSLINKAVSAVTLYRGIKRKGTKMSYEEMRKIFFELLDWAMGDDKLCGAPEKYKDIFNAMLMKEVATDLGMECTDGKKRPITSNDQFNINDLVFLKRNFRYNAEIGRVMCPLALETIVNSVQWYDGEKELEVVMHGKTIAAQIEGFLHSEKFSDKIVEIVRKSYPLVGKLEKKDILEIFSSNTGYGDVMMLMGKFVPE